MCRTKFARDIHQNGGLSGLDQECHLPSGSKQALWPKASPVQFRDKQQHPIFMNNHDDDDDDVMIVIVMMKTIAQRSTTNVVIIIPS